MPLPSFDPRRTAVVTIDMHRGHLDPEVATMPLPAEAAARVTAANAVLVQAARARQVPVVHVVTGYHAVSEIASNPWWAAVRSLQGTKNLLRLHNR